MWKELIDVLGKLSLAYDEVSALAEKKKGTLVTVDMKGLEKILEEEKGLAMKVQTLEKQRTSVLKKISEAEPKIHPDMRLSEMCKLAPSKPVEDRLKALHRKLDDSVQKVRELNQNNMVLTQAALDAVQIHLNRIGGVSVDPVYGKSGKDVVTHKKNFDFKA